MVPDQYGAGFNRPDGRVLCAETQRLAGGPGRDAAAQARKHQVRTPSSAQVQSKSALNPSKHFQDCFFPQTSHFLSVVSLAFYLVYALFHEGYFMNEYCSATCIK